LNGGVKFDTAQSAGFSINPFTTANYSAGDTVLTVGGATIPSAGSALEDTWKPGSVSGALTIAAKPFDNGSIGQSFVFTEQPLVTAIPLPAAMWSALSSLAGIGAIGFVKRFRKTQA
jgi:hypothetical protein